MTKKIFRAMMVLVGAVLLSSIVILMGFLYDYFGNVQQRQLADEAELAAAAVEDFGTAYLAKLKSARYRITWVAADGRVLYDTQKDAAGMENHADRKEIREALQGGEGASIRYSATLLQQTIYAARRLSDGTVLRVSTGRATAGGLALGMIWPMLAVLAAALVLSYLLAKRIARHIVLPLNRLNLEQPLENDTYEELSPILGRLHRQQQSIQDQLHQLTQQRDEFSQIIGSMQQGLVLLDDKQAIVSLNPTAAKLFQTTDSCVGKDFVTVERSCEISRAIQAATLEGHSEVRIERQGAVYQIDISRIESGGVVIGAVLLAFEVTEQAFAERNRREFAANVSHELKTPLQSIIGSAELLENNMVRPEDMPRFIGHIRQQAARLVVLIEDIIRLSQLDEGGALPTEQVELLALCEQVAAGLTEAAEAKGLHITVDGAATLVQGVRRLLYEILYNLCDNAIKYNVENGKVTITVRADAENAIIVVQDSGIGIPPAHQNRVFERFYRVDKSHAKSSGGTGLGLSIVKHAVAYHHGKIELQSEVGRGTAITVTLPRGGKKFCETAAALSR